MAIFVDKNTRILVQGITGREGQFHTRQCVEYGSNVVAGVTPGKGGQELDTIPVYNSVKEAKEDSGANCSLIFVPPPFAADAIMEASAAGIELIVAITEGIPANDMLKVKKYIDPARTVIIDAPPGTSCPVIESIKESDFCILVTEPTPFGLNDLMLAVEVLRKLAIPFGVVVNRSDLGDEKTDQYCQKEGIKILMRIPFDRKIAESYSRGETIVEAISEYKEKFQEMYKELSSTLITNNKL